MSRLTITKEQLAAAFEQKRSAAKMGVLEPLLDANDEAWWIWEALSTLVRDAELAAQAAADGSIERVR